MIKLTAIKPRAKAILYTRFADAAKLGMQDAADAAERDFESTFATWNHQPTVIVKERADGYSLTVKDDVWGMLDKGTRAHPITARNAKFLRFRAGFAPKTRAGFIGSQSGGSSGPFVFRRRIPRHPGTKARGWSRLIAAKYKAQIQRYIEARIREAM